MPQHSPGIVAGIGSDIGWHTFRRSYRSWLDEAGAPMTVQKELMRHASIQTTMNVYGKAMSDANRATAHKPAGLACPAVTVLPVSMSELGLWLPSRSEADTLRLMKRDMDLIRTLLVEIEKQPDDGRCFDIAVPGRTPAEISAHIRLLAEAGLIDAIDMSAMERSCWKPRRLTWDGHEFLDAYRSDTAWKRGKEIVLKAGGALSLEALKVAMPMVLKSVIGGA